MPIKDRKTKLLLLLHLQGADKNIPFVIDEILMDAFDLSMSQKTKGSLSSLLKDALIEKDQTHGDTRYLLTDKGFTELCLEFPYFRFLQSEWDGMWRILSYEIPESKRFIRDRFRREMRGWGLGPWHRSFWLTPHPILEDLKELTYGREEGAYIQAFEATHVVGDIDTLVEKVWQKSELEKTYRDLFKQWHLILSSSKDQNEKFKEILYLLIRTIRTDPGLPSRLVGRNWIGYEAFTLFKEIRSILLK